MAIRIFIESLWALIRNAGPAFLISALPICVVFVCLLCLMTAPSMRSYFAGSLPVVDQGPTQAALWLIGVPLGAAVMGWVGTAWHRMMLRAKTAEPVPTESASVLWRYAGQSLAIWALSLVVVLAVVFVVGLIADLGFGSGSTDRLRGVLMTVGAVGFLYFWLRWGLVLVGIALDKPMTLREAMRATRAFAASALGLSVMIVVVGRLLQALFIAIGQMPAAVALLVSLALIWLAGLLCIAVLTTFYAYCVEGRH